MYVQPNFLKKKHLRDAVKAGQVVTVFQPAAEIFGTVPPENGTAAVEGPHFPKPHTWYARVTLKDGKIIKVK